MNVVSFEFTVDRLCYSKYKKQNRASSTCSFKIIYRCNNNIERVVILKFKNAVYKFLSGIRKIIRLHHCRIPPPSIYNQTISKSEPHESAIRV